VCVIDKPIFGLEHNNGDSFKTNEAPAPSQSKPVLSLVVMQRNKKTKKIITMQAVNTTPHINQGKGAIHANYTAHTHKPKIPQAQALMEHTPYS
jgi:hypothetical protein